MSRQLSPLGAIRKRCLDCKETTTEIKECEFDPKHKEACALWQFRMNKSKKGTSRLKAIRKYCLWCMLESSEEVRSCPTKTCVLFHYRFGRNPSRQGIGQKGGRPENFTNSRRLKQSKITP